MRANLGYAGVLAFVVIFATIALAGNAHAWESSWGHIYSKYCEQDPSCVLYLSFDEGSGTIAYDNSSQGNNGTLVLSLHTDDVAAAFSSYCAGSCGIAGSGNENDQNWSSALTVQSGDWVIEATYNLPEGNKTPFNITYKYYIDPGSLDKIYIYIWNYTSGDWSLFKTVSTEGTNTLTDEINLDDFGVTTEFKVKYYIDSFTSDTPTDFYEEKIEYYHRPQWTSDAKFGNGLLFDTYKEYVSVPTINLQGNWTILFWAKGAKNDYTSWRYIGGRRQMIHTWGNLLYNYGTGETYYLIPLYDKNSFAQWHFYTIKMESKNLSTYRDANRVGGPNTVCDACSDTKIDYIGMKSTNLGGLDSITYDSFIVFNRSLSDEEISEIYRTGWLYLTLRDEDTQELIQNETAYVSVYNVSDLNVVSTYQTTNGEVIDALALPTDFMVTAYTNESYTNQRRKTFFSSGAGEYEAEILLLKDGRGISQPIRVYDRNTYNPLQGAGVKINYSGITIDYGVTDTQGRLWSYLDPYKLYSVEAYKPGYQTAVYQLTPSLNEFVIYLLSLFQKPPKPKFSFNPSNAVLNVNNTYIPMVSIEYYKELEAVTFTVAKSRAHYDYFQLTGQQQAGVVESSTFDMANVSAWCNATYLCSYDDKKITFRYSQSLLNDFGDYVLVIYNYTKIDGEKETAEKTYMFSNFKLDVAGMFTDTQKPWVGLGIILFGTFSVVGSMVRWGFNPTVRQIALIVYIFIVVDYIFGFFPASYLVLSTLILLGAILGGRVL